MRQTEKIEKVVLEERVKYITCDVCGKEIQGRYWKLDIYHFDWGNDNYESYDEYDKYDICSHHCTLIKLDEYFNQCRDQSSLCFDLEEDCFSNDPNH